MFLSNIFRSLNTGKELYANTKQGGLEGMVDGSIG